MGARDTERERILASLSGGDAEAWAALGFPLSLAMRRKVAEHVAQQQSRTTNRERRESSRASIKGACVRNKRRIVRDRLRAERTKEFRVDGARRRPAANKPSKRAA